MERHPDKDNPESCVWISYSHNRNERQELFLEPLSRFGVHDIFNTIKEIANDPNNQKKYGYKGIKPNLSIHNFRRTRATIYFNLRTKDGGLIYSDSQIGMLFGWSLSTVSKRREEYDLTIAEELEKQIFSTVSGEVKDYDTVTTDLKYTKQEMNNLKKSYEKRLTDLEKTIASQKEDFKQLMHIYATDKISEKHKKLASTNAIIETRITSDDKVIKSINGEKQSETIITPEMKKVIDAIIKAVFDEYKKKELKTK